MNRAKEIGKYIARNALESQNIGTFLTLDLRFAFKLHSAHPVFVKDIFDHRVKCGAYLTVVSAAKMSSLQLSPQDSTVIGPSGRQYCENCNKGDVDLVQSK